MATHEAGAALDLVIVSADCPSTLRIHDGIGCCAQAPGCCPVMDSDHRLCVVSTQLNFRTNHDVSRGIFHLRDWLSTLFRTHVDLCQWSSDVSCRLDGVVPCDVASRAGVVDQLYQKFLAILSWHAPRQRLFSATQSALVVDPRVLCHVCCQETGVSTLSRPSLDSGLHRSVRSAQRSFWSHWQDRVARLSRTHPRVAASTIRRTFRSTAASRGDSLRKSGFLQL